MGSINDFWSMNEGTFACLHDSKRTNAFRRAIRNSIKKGDVVVEMGAGTGILSMFAVDAGARKVYAVELDQGNVQSLKKTVSENNYSDNIEVIHGDATTVDLPEEIDFIICEMVATGLIEELQVPAMNNALRFLSPTGRVLLEKYEISLELVWSKADFYNKTFNIIRFELPEMRDMRSVPLSEKVVFKTVHFRQIHDNPSIQETVSFRASADGVVNALRLTGKTFFCDGSTFENSTSYDFPIILPIGPLSVAKGQRIDVMISYRLCEGPHTLDYRILK